MKRYIPYIITCILLLILVGVFVLKSATKTIQYTSAVVLKNTSPKTIAVTRKSYNISQGAMPSIPFQLPTGYLIHIFASNLPDPRDLQFTPSGTLLVSNPNTDEVIALPDRNHAGVADTQKVIISGENHVHGLAFYQNKLYVADVDKVVRYIWDENTLTATKDKILFALPQNNDHNNRTIVFDTLGNMFVSVGSTCNVCNETPQQGGSIWISNANGDKPRVFATGLRNAAFLAMNPKTNELWATEMGRDYLGDDLPPDEINIISQNNNYGWPFCFGNRIHDTNFDKNPNDPCGNTIPPIYEIPAHSAPLGLVFIYSSQFPSDWQGDLFVAYHGSWNRSKASGYKVVHLKVQGDIITGSEDFLTGFLKGDNGSDSLGRPVNMKFDTMGNLYLSDDKAGNVYIIQKQ